MHETPIRHIAVIARGVAGDPRDAAAAVAGALRHAAAIADEAFAAAPGLRAFSFFAPDVDRLLDDPDGAAEARHGCVEGTGALEAAAARLGASLRTCGRVDGLPPEVMRHAAPAHPAPAERTLLLFLRYGGREEIARAASRLLVARPGSSLGDDDLDAWLDTAGVPDPDLVVLAGGAFEAPDAFVWQGSYAELWHTETPWAAFTVGELQVALSDFGARQRRFGK
ncbi:MAG TPA: undecaprenyl diphosphate synthase family protein [bacterium]